MTTCAAEFLCKFYSFVINKLIFCYFYSAAGLVDASDLQQFAPFPPTSLPKVEKFFLFQIIDDQDLFIKHGAPNHQLRNTFCTSSKGAFNEKSLGNHGLV